ncbi:hypothetical protein [Pseudomonas sp. CFBP 5750]
MDFESFSQCLNYMQATVQDKGTLNKVLPIMGTLLGTAFGFALNYGAGRVKDSKAAKNKIMCIGEDIEVIVHDLNATAKECARLVSLLVERAPLAGNRLPGSMSGLCIDSYFIDVAHQYSRNQRYWIQLALERLKEINLKLTGLNADLPLYDRVAALLNLISISMEISRLCKMSQLDAIIPHYEILPYLESLEISRECLAACDMAIMNLNEQNAVLRL